MLLLGIILGYLIGSIPTAYIFGKCTKGIDIREHGSGNVGATNVFRVLGKKPGIMVLVLDILKGLIVVAGVADWLGLTSSLDRIFLAVSVVCGHNWTIFLQFKGGKGIATSLGIIIGLTLKVAAFRPVLFFTLLGWIICFLATGYVSLSSMIAATLFPVIMLITKQSIEFVCLGFVFCAFVIYRHKTNIQRLIKGKESRVNFFSSKKK